MTWRAIVGFRLVTRAPERAAAFYRALGGAVEPPQPIPAGELALLGLAPPATRRRMRFGETIIDLDRYVEAGRPYPDAADAASPCFQHFALVTSDIVAAWATALAAGARPIGGGGRVTLPAASGGATAVKFRDPDGHPLELLQLPDAPPRGGEPLHVDHSAIVATDLAASLAFYRDAGLGDGRRTLNVGSEQAALDGLDRPEVDVVPMSPPEPGPHLELLHYRRPAARSGAEVAVHDVAATRTVWRADRAALVRDPDGHLHQLEP